MNLINWTEEISVGVKELDDQHRQIFKIINDLYDMMKKGEGQDQIKLILGNMIDCENMHLSTEEKYFDKFSYPEKEEHKALHKEYKDKLNNFIQKEKEITLPFEILDFLEDWWLGHIRTVDKKYSAFFNKNGLR